jgi:hypothetical protein
MADTDRGQTQCPYAQPRLRSGAEGEEVQQCIDGELVTYDAKTLKRIRRERHDDCEGTGAIKC